MALPTASPLNLPLQGLVLGDLGICNEASLAMRLQVSQGTGHIQPSTEALLRRLKPMPWGSKLPKFGMIAAISSDGSKKKNPSETWGMRQKRCGFMGFYVT